MPVVFKGNYRCQKCKKQFDWVYFETIRTKLGSAPIIVETLPQEPIAHIVGKDQQGISQLSVLCPHCRYENIFLYDRI